MSDGVVLLHGIARTSASMVPMRRALDSAGFLTLNLDYASRRKPLDALAEDIHSAISDFATKIEGRLHLVTHSMGGLVARVYLARHRPAPLGRVVMLGPPNNGSEVADALRGLAPYRAFFGPAGQELTTRHGTRLQRLLRPIDYELGIIAGNRSINLASSILLLPGPNDGRVTVRSTRLDGIADHLVVRAAHPFLMRDRTVIVETVAFLRDGCFKGGEARRLITPPIAR